MRLTAALSWRESHLPLSAKLLVEKLYNHIPGFAGLRYGGVDYRLSEDAVRGSLPDMQVSLNPGLYQLRLRIDRRRQGSVPGAA